MATPFNADETIKEGFFINESERSVDPADDAGKVVQLEEDGKLSREFMSFTISALAGQALSKGEAVYINNVNTTVESTGSNQQVAQTSDNTDFQVSNPGKGLSMGQIFTLPSAPVLDGLNFHQIRITSAVAKGWYVSGTGTVPLLGAVIKAVSGGVPAANLSNEQSATAAEYFFGTASPGREMTATFSSPALVQPNTQYALVCWNGAGAGMSPNQNYLRYQNSNVYANGYRVSSNNSWGTWTQHSGEDMFFRINYQYEYVRKPGYIYKATANGTPAVKYNNYVGIVGKDVAIESPASVQVLSAISGFSGLTVGAIYYLSNTAGQISTSPGANTVRIGIAITADTLILQQ